MTRRIWLSGAMIVTMVATAVLLSRSHRSDASMPARVVKAVSAADVRVRHDFVTAVVPSAIEDARPTLARPGAPLSAAAIPPAVLPTRVRPTSRTDVPRLTRIGRAVAGDGRHRPEPFPRVR